MEKSEKNGGISMRFEIFVDGDRIAVFKNIQDALRFAETYGSFQEYVSVYDGETETTIKQNITIF